MLCVKPKVVGCPWRKQQLSFIVVEEDERSTMLARARCWVKALFIHKRLFSRSHETTFKYNLTSDTLYNSFLFVYF